jgi:RNA polymerase sigma-70 factor (ECF subfamily)
MEINREIFDAFDQFELEDLSYLNEKERHYDSVEFSDDLLGSHAFRKEEMTDEIALTSMQDKALHKAIDGLPELQRRRLIWYYFDEMTFSEIAQREGCEYQAVQESIYRGRERIKKVLTDLRK